VTERVLGTGAVAVLLKVRPCTVQAYARDGRIPFDVTPGGHRRYDLDEVRAALITTPVRRDKMTEQAGDFIAWATHVADHDYDAAENYLSITIGPVEAKARAGELRKAKITVRRANDILRACNRKPLPLTDPGVLRDLKKVLMRGVLSPVLLSGGDIADGYHRVSLAYALDPFADVPLKIES
jgi:hypothetical protein